MRFFAPRHIRERNKIRQFFCFSFNIFVLHFTVSIKKNYYSFPLFNFNMLVFIYFLIIKLCTTFKMLKRCKCALYSKTFSYRIDFLYIHNQQQSSSQNTKVRQIARIYSILKVIGYDHYHSKMYCPRADIILYIALLSSSTTNMTCWLIITMQYPATNPAIRRIQCSSIFITKNYT